MIVKWIGKRMMMGGVVLIVVSFLSFSMLHFAPGNLAAAYYGGNAQTITAYEIERINEAFALDRPVIERYFAWLKEVCTGNLGYSIKEGRPVVDILLERVSNTILLVFMSLFFIIILSLYIGIKAGMSQNPILDKVVSVTSVVMSSIPTFWLGILFIWFFSLKLGILPSSGTKAIDGTDTIQERLTYLLLPASVIIMTHVGIYARFLQESMKIEREKYYVLVAYANGVDKKWIERGMLKNALGPYLNYLAMTVPSFIGGSIIIESLFSWAGLGQLVVKSVAVKDFPVLLGAILVMGLFVVITLLILDSITYMMNPKLRKEGYK